MPKNVKKLLEEWKKSISKSHQGKHIGKNNSMWGRSQSEYQKRIASEVHKGKKISKRTREKLSYSHFGRKFSNEHKLKISIAHKGKILSKETRIKMSQKTDELKKKISEFMKIRMKGNKIWLGKHHSEESKRKMRISSFEYAKKVFNIICPRVGKNEEKILNKLEQELNHKILRQFKVEGYFVDGYIHKLNLVIEVDEKPKDFEKDIERQKIIENKLNCNFMRINDFE